MKNIFLLSLAFILTILSVSPVFADHTYVNGYYKSNGTYVKGYNKTSPNSTKFDNFSTKGNINPYTSKSGTVNPYTNYNSSFNSKPYKTYKMK